MRKHEIEEENGCRQRVVLRRPVFHSGDWCPKITVETKVEQRRVVLWWVPRVRVRCAIVWRRVCAFRHTHQGNESIKRYLNTSAPGRFDIQL